jgi:hypothetical protein
MLSAPTSIPATTHPDLATGFGEATLRCSPSRACNPAVSASRIAGSSPADDIRLGSSKTAETV